MGKTDCTHRGSLRGKLFRCAYQEFPHSKPVVEHIVERVI